MLSSITPLPDDDGDVYIVKTKNDAVIPSKPFIKDLQMTFIADKDNVLFDQLLNYHPKHKINGSYKFNNY